MRMRGRHLCEELMIEIFTRLPSKTLVQCRSVSKSWYSYIGSPDFIRMYTCRSQQKLVIRHRTYNENQEGEYEGFYTLHSRDKLPLCPTRGYVGIPQLPFPFSYSIIVGSCDGIVCLYDYSNNSIKLWNPSIRRTVILPDCPRRCYSEVEVAFGYDPIADDYKVVRLPIINVNRGGRSYVYAMKTDAWCLIDSPMPDFRKVKTKACFVSGALHWLAQRYKKSNWYILTFDLSTHVFSSIVSPHITRTVVPTALRGCLAIIINESSIWVRRDDSWSVEIKLEKNNDVGDLKGVLQLGTTGDLIFDLYSIGYKMYNPNTRACASLVDFDDAYFLLDVAPCVESIQLLDMGISC